MPTILRDKDMKRITTYEPPYVHDLGICGDTVENIDPPFTLHHVIMPPGVRSRVHYHINCTRGVFYLKGRHRVFIGPEHDQEIYDVEAGDYIYCPRGVIHHGLNLSDTEPVEIICTYVGTTTRETSGKVLLEPK